MTKTEEKIIKLKNQLKQIISQNLTKEEVNRFEMFSKQRIILYKTSCR